MLSKSLTVSLVDKTTIKGDGHVKVIFKRGPKTEVPKSRLLFLPTRDGIMDNNIGSSGCKIRKAYKEILAGLEHRAFSDRSSIPKSTHRCCKQKAVQFSAPP